VGLRWFAGGGISPFAAREDRLTHIISASRVLAGDGFAVDYFGRADMPSPASPQTLLALLDIELPIVQAQMAGVSSPAMAAAVGNAGALGSIGVGATNVAGARKMIAEIRERSNRPFNVNFCHQPARSAPVVEAAWIDRLRPEFNRLGAAPPTALTEIYKSFVEDDDMLAALLADKPKVVSFHFGAPSSDRVQALRNAGILLLGSATSVDEARILVAAGVHAVVAQGYEAGGHRGVFRRRRRQAWHDGADPPARA
jgi:nitronate monooxygenase